MTRREALAASRAAFLREQAEIAAKKKPAQKRAQNGGRRPKLTTSHADSLRQCYWIGRELTAGKLAKLFGISRSTVLDYAKRKQVAHRRVP